MGPRAAARGNDDGRGDPPGGVLASMGPRAAARGNEPMIRDTPRLASLQWGREQLPVEMPLESPRWQGPAALKWARAQLLAEMVPARKGLLDSGRFNGAASSCSRKYRQNHQGQRGYRASMGPRAAARGNQRALHILVAHP